MISHVDHANPERIPLEACVETLRGRREAVGRFQGGHTHFQEDLRIFNEVANEQGWFLPTAPAELSLQPSDEGNEHQVWFRGNLIFMSDGLLAPIDLRIQKLSGSLFVIVKSLTATP